MAKSAADGYTLLIGINGPAAINKFLYKNLDYDSDRDLMPISLLASAPQLLVVTPSVEANDFKSPPSLCEEESRTPVLRLGREAAALRT